MNELQAQKLIVDAVLAYGGYATKLSHRFVIGIPDLLVKLPELPAMYLECKIRDEPKRIESFVLDVTPLQKRHLMDSWDAGMLSGCASFTRVKSRWIGLYVESTSWLASNEWTVGVKNHEEIKNNLSKEAKYDAVCSILEGFGRSNVDRGEPWCR